jgi:acetyltransferase-like isoleucine patch superfamily enzyme
LYYRFSKTNVRIKLPFKAFAKVKITGPGRVSIDKNCSAALSTFKGLTIVTLSDTAVVTIGKNCNLQGITICCRDRVEIGAGTITAICLVQDSLFVNKDEARSKLRNYTDVKGEVVIGSNAWLSNDVIVLGRSRIGEDCVLSVGSVCKDIELRAYSLANGNPVKRGLPIDNLLKITGMR